MCYSERPSTESRTTKRARVDSDESPSDASLLHIECREQSVSCSLPSEHSIFQADSQKAPRQHPSISASSTLKGRSTLDPPHNSPRYQYDEGMFLFRAPIDVPKNDILQSYRSAVTLYNTGLMFTNTRKYQEARVWFEFAAWRLSMTPTFFKDCSMLAVRIHHNMGYCCFCLGENELAMNFLTVSLELAEVGGSSILEIAAIRNCIGVLYFHKQSPDCKKSLAIFEKSLSVFRRMLKPASPLLATLLNNIGRVHYLNSDYAKALSAYNEALSIRKLQLSPLSMDLAATICNKGQTHHRRGELDSAMECYEEFLVHARSQLGPNSRDIAVILKCMAEIHHQKKAMQRSCQLYEEALTIIYVSLGKFHPDVASTMNKLGNIYFELNQHEKAHMYYMEGLEIEKSVLHPTHPHLLVTLMNIAQVYRQRGDFKRAFQYYSDVHQRTVDGSGENSLESAKALSNMALMQYQLKSHTEAFDLYQQALQIQRDHYKSDNNLDVAASLNSIGLVLFGQGMHDTAKKCFYDCLRIRRDILGLDHHDVAIVHYNIATIHLETGDDAGAIKCYNETLRIERKALGPQHHDVVLTLQHLGLVYQQRGELEKALPYLEEALDIECSLGDLDRQDFTIKLLNLIGNIHLQLGNVGEMMNYYTVAMRDLRSRRRPVSNLVIAGYNYYGLSKMHPPHASVA